MSAHREPTLPLVLVGGTLAAVVAAVERARAGLPTTIVQPGGPWGGYFGGVQTGGRLWDAGMVLYEFTSFRCDSGQPPLAGYDPLVRNDIGRYCHTVERFVSRHQVTRAIRTPEMLLDGQRHPDWLMANRLEALPGLPGADCMRAELAAARAQREASPWHPRRKGDWPADGSDGAGRPLYFDEVSRHVHGDVLHDTLVTPFVRKVLGRDHSGLAALYHRMTWLPLYWPETLAGWLEGERPPLAPTVFSHAQGEPVAALCQRLVQEMLGSPWVTVVQEQVSAIRRTAQGFEVALAGAAPLQTRRLGWAQSLALGLAAAGLADDVPADDRLALMLGFLRLPAHALARPWSVMHLLDASIGLYRATHVDDCSGQAERATVDLVVEANPEAFARVHPQAVDDTSTVEAMRTDLVRAGLLDAAAAPSFAKLLRLKAALPLPTPRAVQGSLHAHRRLGERLPGIELIGPAAGPFSNSFSDQVVQGLALAARADGARSEATETALAEVCD